ncbi:unnamed protein product [Hymenolepis diminuta]|uniref:Protein LTV1 homolog n=1 Tax=Hymenolepis diminuta TaxID=6216 RepID=A0A0R3SI82_HYMDI|nr:unnamed protein product [Hymenolepis diminuta]
MASNDPNSNAPRGTKRNAEEAFGQKLMTDVPEHFNYGVFYNDDYNYMKHMKTMKEFIEDKNYAIEGNEEDSVLPENYAPPIVEPVIEDDSIDEELEIYSDEELIAEVGELEDNFVELAGGKHVRLSDDEDEDEELAHAHKSINPDEDLPQPSTSYLPLHKVKMMESYLYGTKFSEALDYPSVSLCNITDAVARKAALLFQLLRQTKSRNGCDGLSMVSGASFMSDSLQTVVDADRIMTSKKVPKAEDWNCSDSQVKIVTLQAVQEMDEPKVDDDPLKDWIGKEKSTDSILTFMQQNDARREVVKQPEMLTMPKRKTNGIATKHPEPLSSNQSDDYSDSEDGRSQNIDTSLHRRVKGETSEQKKARKTAIKAQKRERQQARKMNKQNFCREKLVSTKFSGKTIVD